MHQKNTVVEYHRVNSVYQLDPMDKFITIEYNKMMTDLDGITVRATNTLQLAENAYHAVTESLIWLKKYIEDKPIETLEAEIEFFKTVKPLFLRELIYYREMYYIESCRPVAGKEDQENYLKHARERIRLFFERNTVFYNYYKTGKTHLDGQYFSRQHQPDSGPEYTLEIDTQFSTVHSYKLAKLQAYEQLNHYIDSCIYKLHQVPTSQVETTGLRRPLKWTETKVALIELAYALQSRGAINNGQTDVKQVVDTLSAAFDVDLGNYYAVFQQNIRIRKKNRTAFLDQLKEHLERRMDEQDENPRY